MKTLSHELPHNKRLGTVFNNDINNILCALDGRNATPEDYLRPVYAILDAKPGVLAQNVGIPDAVIYRSEVATIISKYLVEVFRLNWPNDVDNAIRETNALVKLFELGTDPLTLTIKACRERGVPIIASYRMNAEDWYYDTWMLSDFGRAHPEYRIPKTPLEKRIDMEDNNAGAELEFTGALDPAFPEVYNHRMAIFREVAEKYDIDGIEFDWRRWTHMISDPHNNHPVLTRMVRETCKMLNEVARRKGRSRLLLGVRVGPMLDGEFNLEEFLGVTSYPNCWWAKTTPEFRAKEFPGAAIHQGPDQSCRDLGLDVKTWIEEKLVDYVCPSLFWPTWPGLPKTKEFIGLAKNTDVGIYPTLFPLPAWVDEEGPYKGPINLDDVEKLFRYKNEFCQLALDIYRDGADGISTFNWYFHLRKAKVSNLWTEYYGYGPGGEAVQEYILSILGDPAAIRRYKGEQWVLPPKE